MRNQKTDTILWWERENHIEKRGRTTSGFSNAGGKQIKRRGGEGGEGQTSEKKNSHSTELLRKDQTVTERLKGKGGGKKVSQRHPMGSGGEKDG